MTTLYPNHPTDRDCLDAIHAFMAVPFDWTADTIELIQMVLTERGYTFPDPDEAAALETARPDGVVPADLAPWHPADRVPA